MLSLLFKPGPSELLDILFCKKLMVQTDLNGQKEFTSFLLHVVSWEMLFGGAGGRRP